MQQNNNLGNYLKLHFIIFIWGFTAILGALITLDAIPIVWYRLMLTIPFLYLWSLYSKLSLKVELKVFLRFAFLGLVIAIHWVAFFQAIKISNVSVTLITLSTGAFFTSLIEPVFFKRRVIFWEIFLGISIVFILYYIFKGDYFHTQGMLWALLAALTSSLFSVINGLYVKRYHTDLITFYEFSIGAVFVTIFLAISGSFNAHFFDLKNMDWIYLLILSGVCTAYAGMVSIRLMKHISPFTIMLSINLEPVYGIILALLIFGEKEKMTPDFYIGAFLILGIVVFNSVLKIKSKNAF